MTLTDAQARAIIESALGRPKQVQSAEGMVTQYSANDLIKLLNYVSSQNVKDETFKGMGMKVRKPPDARNRISTST